MKIIVQRFRVEMEIELGFFPDEEPTTTEEIEESIRFGKERPFYRVEQVYAEEIGKQDESQES